MIRSLVVLSFVAVTAAAQVNVHVPLTFYLPDSASYDPSIPTPEQFFGFQVGEWHLSPDQLHAYMHRLDELSDRIAIRPMGLTVERRPMLLLVITSPEHHANLEQIREQHLRLSDPGTAAPDLATMPVVVWMGYSVHGNEASGANAAAVVAYHFAASRSAETLDQLRQAVILLNPSINPDGLNRFASWVNANRGREVVAQPSSREHNEPWPGGRGNHYWFDLNRDWMPLVHPESRARVEAYYAWRPNLLTDHHEMGTNATFFFQPGVPKRDHPLTPAGVRELTTKLAAVHAEALDRIGSLYYTGENFDDFYVGKGSSFPDITGGIGILFEQASSRGHAQSSPGGMVTFPFAVRHQVVTSLSSVRGATAMRKEFLQHQRQSAVTAVAAGEASPVKAYLVSDGGDVVRAEEFASLLTRHQIDVFRTARTVRQGPVEVEAGRGYIVPARQGQYRLLTSLFERRTRFDDSLFYDVSSWNLPMAYGLPFVELNAVPAGSMGERVTAPRPSSSTPVPVDGVALTIDWNNAAVPTTLYRLLAAGVPVRVATQEFESQMSNGLRRAAAGTLVVPMPPGGAHLEAARKIVQEGVRADALEVGSIKTGLAASGVDLGSSTLVPLALPRIALLTGSGASSTDAGEVWHFFDARLGIPITLLPTESVGRTDLSAFNVLVLAGGSFTSIDSAGRAAVTDWVGRGNTIIATEQAVEWAIGARLTSATLKRPATRKDSAVVLAYGDEENFRGARATPGAIVEARIDRTHPLGFGTSSATLPMFKSSGLALEIPRNPFAVPVRFTERPLLSGYLHADAAKHIAGGGSVIVSAVREGRSIVMTDNPVFRGYWRGTERLLVNAVFFGPVIRGSSMRPAE